MRASPPGTRSSASGESTSPSIGWFGTSGSAACDAEPPREHRRERLHLHLAEARAAPRSAAAGRPCPSRRARRGSASPPYSSATTAHSSCTRFAMLPGKRWIAGFSRKTRSSRSGSSAGDLRGVEPAEPLLQLERAGERGRNRHLLVEDEADQERERLGGEQLVRLGIAGEVERVGHDAILPSDTTKTASAAFDRPLPRALRVRERMVEGVERLVALRLQREHGSRPLVDDDDEEPVVRLPPEERHVDAVALAVRQLRVRSRVFVAPFAMGSAPSSRLPETR